jgi:Alpha amylase, catalytic domain
LSILFDEWLDEEKNLNRKSKIVFVCQRNILSIFLFQLKKMDSFNILHELGHIACSAVRPNQPFYTAAEFVPENRFIVKANNGLPDACWSQAFYGNLENNLTDKVGLKDMKYAIANDNVVNYIDCHDNKRLLFRLGKNHFIFDDEAFLRLHLAAILLGTSVGISLIWQGNELGDASSFEQTDKNK